MLRIKQKASSLLPPFLPHSHFRRFSSASNNDDPLLCLFKKNNTVFTNSRTRKNLNDPANLQLNEKKKQLADDAIGKFGNTHPITQLCILDLIEGFMNVQQLSLAKEICQDYISAISSHVDRANFVVLLCKILLKEEQVMKPEQSQAIRPIIFQGITSPNEILFIKNFVFDSIVNSKSTISLKRLYYSCGILDGTYIKLADLDVEAWNLLTVDSPFEVSDVISEMFEVIALELDSRDKFGLYLKEKWVHFEPEALNPVHYS